MDLHLAGRRVLVVGGSQGIGRAAAALFAAEGAEVAIAARTPGTLQDAADEIAAGGARPAVFAADVTRDGAAEALAGQVAALWGGLDILVSAVGASIRGPFETLDDAAWRANYDLNVLSAVRMMRAALPLLRQGRDPAAVLLGSASARMPAAQQVVSNVHKAGLLALVKTLALELAGDGVRVNAVAPGRTLTPLWEGRADRMARDEGRSRDAVLAEFSAEIPMGRFGSAAEVAAMVVWLASPRASYVTSQTVNVDGGIARGLL